MMNNIRNFTAAFVATICASAFAQSPGIVYPVNPVANAKVPVTSAQAASAASTPAASAPVAAPASSPDASKPAKGSTKGPKTFTSTISGSAARAEAEAAKSMNFPAFPAGDSSSQQSSPGATDTTGTSSRVVLPKWLTESLNRASNKTEITVKQGVTEIVSIARVFPNRFVTPFECAELITTDDKVDHDIRGGVVTIATLSDRPVGVYISECNTDRAIGLTLMPMDIPQRELRISLDDSWKPVAIRPSKDAVQAHASDTHVDYLTSMLKTLAAGDIPDGHVMSSVRPELMPECRIPGVTTTLGQMVEGTTDRIGVYIASNTTMSVQPIQEQGCYMKGVLAVAAFPLPTLAPGQSTELYVVMSKTPADASTSAKRRPVLAGGN